MKIAVINGQNHKGSTYHIGKQVADKLGGEVTEFFFREISAILRRLYAVFSKIRNTLSALWATEKDYRGYGRGWCTHLHNARVCLSLHRLNESISWSLRLSLDGSPSRTENVHKAGGCNFDSRRFGYKICQQGYRRQYVLLGRSKTYRYGVNVRATNYSGVTDELKRKLTKRLPQLPIR